MRGTLMAVMMAVAIGGPAGAQQAGPRPSVSRAEVPAIVTRGLDVYRAQGLGPAVDVWLVGSPVAGESTRAQMVGALAPLEAVYGRMRGADVVDVVPVGDHVRRVYVVVRLEHGPLYAFFECYQVADGSWIIPQFLMNAKAAEILPARDLGG